MRHADAEHRERRGELVERTSRGNSRRRSRRRCRSVKPISVATDARISVLPTARPTSLSTGRPVAIEVPRSPCSTFHSQSAVLDRQRLVEAVGLRASRPAARRWRRAADRGERIAGREMHEQEADDADAERDRRDVEEALAGCRASMAPLRAWRRRSQLGDRPRRGRTPDAGRCRARSLVHGDRREVLEPVLGLDEALHLGAHARAG